MDNGVILQAEDSTRIIRIPAPRAKFKEADFITACRVQTRTFP